MPTDTAATLESRLVIVRMAGLESAETLGAAVRRGLSARPKTLPCRFFYDVVGSELFEQICELPEYYLTRAEDEILNAHADAMVAGWSRPPVLIELGSGSSTKTRRLIAAALRAYGRLHYAPIDVSTTMLEESAGALIRSFPGLQVTGYAADYREALHRACRSLHGPKLVVFLGSSLGNYDTSGAVDLLAQIAADLGPADRLLLGTDMVKDRAALEAAYDDRAGVTARFNKNLLARINHELGADFHLDRFAHQVHYREDLARIEMHLVSLEHQVVRIPGAGLVVPLGAGETIHTENAHKYTPESLQDLARRSGYAEEKAWVDDLGRFRVQRWRPCRASSRQEPIERDANAAEI